MANFANFKIEWKTRACMVEGKPGYFHTWEQYSQPVGASLLVGGPPEGVISRLWGIVEFAEGIERVDPSLIQFCDEEHANLVTWTNYMVENTIEMNMKEKENGQC